MIPSSPPFLAFLLRHGEVDLMEILEVRVGDRALQSKDFKQAHLDKTQSKLLPFAVTIMHGKHFRLKQLCIVCNSENEVTAWSDGLYHFSRIAQPEL